MQKRQTHGALFLSGHSRTFKAWLTSSLKPRGCPSGIRSFQPRMRAQWCLNKYRRPLGVSRLLTLFFTVLLNNWRRSRSPSIWRLCLSVAPTDDNHCRTMERICENMCTSLPRLACEGEGEFILGFETCLIYNSTTFPDTMNLTDSTTVNNSDEFVISDCDLTYALLQVMYYACDCIVKAAHSYSV